MDFVISDNILFEIETDNPSIVISILEKEKHKDVHDFTKHVYFQRLLRKSTVIYLDKDKIDKLLIVVTNTDPQSNANVNFNLFNFNTKSSEFFGPGGLGFVVSLILFCIDRKSVV